MDLTVSRIIRSLFGADSPQGRGSLWPRWLFLRALGLIFFSAFYSLVFQINGLIGPGGILPAGHYLRMLSQNFGVTRYWYAPTLLWLSSSPLALQTLCWVGMTASILLFLNVWPRASTAVCFVTFLSFISTAQDFSSYQSDGMLLAAGFLALFFAPPGLRPRLGKRHPPSWASLFLLQWLWFRIYFESGVAKIAGGDPEWRHLTALDHYYAYGPLPNWIGWYVQHFPHWFNASVCLFTLVMELGLVWMLFLPRRYRILCFFLATPFQIGIILTANLAFLNYFVLALGVLLLDDRFIRRMTERWAPRLARLARTSQIMEAQKPEAREPDEPPPQPVTTPAIRIGWLSSRLSSFTRRVSIYISALFLTWIFFVTTVLLLLMLFPRLPFPMAPVEALEPFRIANQYGLFGRMTRARYEIEFQGTCNGKTWIPYPYRYKPQNPRQAPRIFAPYQPRFDWNLWFASLGQWPQYQFVVRVEVLLLEQNPAVLSLFQRNPFTGCNPREVRAVVWQYWFTSLKTKRKTGLWWRREFKGLYAPALERLPDGRIVIVQWPQSQLPSP